MRLDSYLASTYVDLSRSQIQQLIKKGMATVNDYIITKPAYDVNDDDKVALVALAKPDFINDIKEFSKCVIYQDDNVVVVNKPAGVLVHAKGGVDSEFTVADFVRSLYNSDELKQSMDNNRLGIVHRLDRATSGIMICALNNATQTMLARQFADRKTKKVYLAVLEKMPPERNFRINLPIGRNLSRPSTFRVDGKGKLAITDCKYLATLSNGRTLVELRPITGRTHQLRVHMSYLGCPIVGDTVYGTAKCGEQLLLHAYQLEITIPGKPNNQRRIFVAQTPSYLPDVVEAGLAKDDDYDA